jgi:uncharacterized protein YjiK
MTSNRKPRYWIQLIFCSGLVCQTLLDSCSSSPTTYPSPPGYDLNKAYAYKLPSALDEISGIVYYAKDSSLFAIQDEKGFLFKIHLRIPLAIDRWKFSNSGDYEDVALVDSNFYVLKSKGIVEKFNFLADSAGSQPFKLTDSGKNEFETLYFDSSLHQLVLLCKNCEEDKKKEVSSWTFDIGTNAFSPSYKIDASRIRDQLSENDKFKFKPSAAAYNPLTGELYVIASVSKALVILNRDHTVKASYKLNPSLFKQPEGMTFTPAGDLIVSNEAAGQGSADILLFKYHKPRNR